MGVLVLRQDRNIYIALFLVEAKSASEVLGDGLLEIIVGGVSLPDGASR
jgi:hypothetical protein